MMYWSAWLALLMGMFPHAAGVLPEARNCFLGMSQKSDPYVMWDYRIGNKTVCDSWTDRGGWIFVMRRHLSNLHNENVDWHRTFEGFKWGFGDPASKNFWLGLENVRKLLSRGSWHMRIDLRDEYMKWYSIVYDHVSIGNEAQRYKLDFTGGSGGNLNHSEYAGLWCSDDRYFMTYDWDYHSCVETHHSGWWHGDRKWCFRYQRNIRHYCTGANFASRSPWRRDSRGWYYMDYSVRNHYFFHRWLTAVELKVRKYFGRG